MQALWSNKLKIKRFGEVMKFFPQGLEEKESHGKEERRSEWIVIFLSPQWVNLLTMQRSCFILALGSNSDKFLRLNPSHWINSKLILPRYFLSFLTSQLSRSLVNESHLANGRKSQKYKIYQINVRRKPFPNIIAESFSATVIFFHTSEN